jgi:hypothetical protein
MRILAFNAVLLLFLLVGTTSCFEPGDDLTPSPNASIKKTTQVAGTWKVYEVTKKKGERLYDTEERDAALTLNDDGSLSIRRRGVDYVGRWELDQTTYSHINIELDIETEQNVKIPNRWSLQKFDSDELWVSTIAKTVKMRRM